MLSLLGKSDYITKDTLVIVEADLKTDFSYLAEFGFYMEKDKRYKTNRHVFLRRLEK